MLLLSPQLLVENLRLVNHSFILYFSMFYTDWLLPLFLMQFHIPFYLLREQLFTIVGIFSSERGRLPLCPSPVAHICLYFLCIGINHKNRCGRAPTAGAWWHRCSPLLLYLFGARSWLHLNSLQLRLWFFLRRKLYSAHNMVWHKKSSFHCDFCRVALNIVLISVLHGCFVK